MNSQCKIFHHCHSIVTYRPDSDNYTGNQSENIAISFSQLSDLRTKCQWQDAIAQNPNTKNARHNPKHINQWYFIHWRFVHGIQTRYPIVGGGQLTDSKKRSKLTRHHSQTIYACVESRKPSLNNYSFLPRGGSLKAKILQVQILTKFISFENIFWDIPKIPFAIGNGIKRWFQKFPL